MKLVIVESPTKAKTISQFLGKGYDVESSYGHVRDLPKSKLGIDVKNDFKPTYAILPKAKERIEELKRTAQKAEAVILATDEDREGEAIAWHLTHALDLNGRPQGAKRKASQDKLPTAGAKPVERIVFHEITKEAIEEALKRPRALDLNLIDAQQARRILDRLVGYELSPFLWRKVRYGLSAGRVQSVAVRLIVEREREIENFKKEEYWTIEGDFSKPKSKDVFRGRLNSVDGKTLEKMSIGTETEAQKIVSDLQGADYKVKDVSSKSVSRTPSPPFTTSTLQQEAYRKLGFSAKQTMLLAQNLYENGFITYMRTDSFNLAESALRQARETICSEFGEKYALDEPRRFATKTKGAQEAHEAIRPTVLSKKSEDLRLSDRKQKNLYELIWKRTVASQMKEALLEQTAADIEAKGGKYVFRANGQAVIFEGFMKVYAESRDEANEKENGGILPKLETGQALEAKNIIPIQHFTEPPPRYTDATLVKTLEAAGVGRPSTYAPILSTIQDRGYTEKIERKYNPTETGRIVNDILVEHFPEIVDINFTSHIEEEFDEIASGGTKWTDVMREFYEPFKKHLSEKETEVGKYSETSETPCPHCGKMMIVKFGRFGKFLACPDPESKVTLPMPEEAAAIEKLRQKTKDERCPICGKPMEVKRGRFGFFLGCSDYPNCKGVKKIVEKTGFKCPACLASPERKDDPGDVIEKRARGRRNVFYGCSRYPECTFISNKKPESQKGLEETFEKMKNSSKKTRGKKPVPTKKNDG